MPVDLKIARPFVYQDPNGTAWELGIALYPAMDDAFAADWHVTANTEASVLARGGTLFQWRRLVARDASGNYVPIFSGGVFNGHAPIFLDPAVNPEYTQGIEPGWPPLFIEHCDRFPMETPPPEAGCASGASLGFNGYRSFGDSHARPLRTTIRVYPGDPAPPASRAAPPPHLDYTKRAQFVPGNEPSAIPAPPRFPPSEPADPAPITYRPAPPASYYTWTDPRSDVRATMIEQPQPAPDTGRDLPPYAVDAARLRHRLERGRPASLA